MIPVAGQPSVGAFNLPELAEAVRREGLDMAVHDHVIFGRAEVASFKALGLI